MSGQSGQDVQAEEPEPEFISWRAPSASPVEPVRETAAAPLLPPPPPPPPGAYARRAPDTLTPPPVIASPASSPAPPIAPPPGPPQAAPAPPSPPVAPPGAPPAVRVMHQWRSLRGLRTALTVLLSSTVAGLVLLGAALVNRYVIADRIDTRGPTVTRILDLRDANDLIDAAYLIVWGLTLATAVVFIVWLWRAAKNNEALGRPFPRFGPGWAIGAWFIPLASLVLPVMVVQELWRGSSAEIPRDDPAWRRARGSALVGLWWASYIVWPFLVLAGQVSPSDYSSADRFVDRVLDTDPVAFLGAVFGAVAGALAILVVRGLTRGQEQALLAQRAAWDQEHA